MTRKTISNTRELTDFEKGMILAIFYTLQSICLVASLVCRPWSTVKPFLQHATERGRASTIFLSLVGKLIKRQRRLIPRAVKKDRTMTRRELQATYAPDVSILTIDRIPRKHNIRKWRTTKQPKLTEIHVQSDLNAPGNISIGQ